MLSCLCVVASHNLSKKIVPWNDLNFTVQWTRQSVLSIIPCVQLVYYVEVKRSCTPLRIRKRFRTTKRKLPRDARLSISKLSFPSSAICGILTLGFPCRSPIRGLDMLGQFAGRLPAYLLERRTLNYSCRVISFAFVPSITREIIVRERLERNNQFWELIQG